jgi:HlyD family secretion protein
MTTRRKLILAAIAVALVAAAGAWRWRAGARGSQPPMETAQVDRGRIVAKVTATGTLSALVTVQVGSQVSGRIAEIHVDFNSRVRKGQLIARIDPQLFEAAVAQARANAVAAEGNVAKARAQSLDADRQLARARTLAERKLVAAADLDTAQAGADAARASIQAAEGALAQTRAALHQAQVNLAYTRIVSPTDGIVISRNVDVGQTVAASLQAPTLFVIAEDLSKMQVNTSVAEADVGRLRAGMPASFTVDAFPGEIFRGEVRQVRNSPQTVQNVVTYDAVVDVANPELKLRPGMTATVTFVHAEKEDVLRMPNSALRFRPPPGFGNGGGGRANGAARQGGDGGGGGGGGARAAEGGGGGPAGGGAAPARDGGAPGGRMVWVVRGERPEQVKVRLGISDGSVTEVVEGDVQAGDTVVTDAMGSAGGGREGGSRMPRLF